MQETLVHPPLSSPTRRDCNIAKSVLNIAPEWPIPVEFVSLTIIVVSLSLGTLCICFWFVWRFVVRVFCMWREFGQECWRMTHVKRLLIPPGKVIVEFSSLIILATLKHGSASAPLPLGFTLVLLFPCPCVEAVQLFLAC